MPVDIQNAHRLRGDAVADALTLLLVSMAVPFFILCVVADATHGGQLTRSGLLTTIETFVPDETP
ncbi:MAG: hypothetical protein ABSA13_15630 [Beijerinckiaceae bacterium]